MTFLLEIIVQGQGQIEIMLLISVRWHKFLFITTKMTAENGKISGDSPSEFESYNRNVNQLNSGFSV